jgi:hypothetical protein
VDTCGAVLSFGCKDLATILQPPSATWYHSTSPLWELRAILQRSDATRYDTAEMDGMASSKAARNWDNC